MTREEPESAPSPSALPHPVLAVEPLDDTGAPTQARFKYQHHCTARIVFGMLAGPEITLVVCETHEDAVVIYADGTVELVSMKHRDDQTLPLLAVREATVALFRRWQHTGRFARCRLMSNGKPVGGPGKAKAFIDACHSGRPEPWIDRIKDWTRSDDSDELSRFLASFSVDEPTGAKEHIAAVNCQQVVAPALAAAKLSHLDAPRAHDRVVELIERCNRDEPVDQDAMLRYLADPNRASPTVQMQQRIGRRAIDRRRLEEALLEPTIPAPHAQLSFEDAHTHEGSTLERKLVLGGFGQTTINAARLLRANWEATETRWRADVPGGDPQFTDLRGRALAAAAKAERETMSAEAYGAAMHARIEEDFTVARLLHRPSFAMDDDLLLGLVYELTDECHVWWSSPQSL